MNSRSNNHFDFLRFVAASLVLFSHAFTLAQGSYVGEPLFALAHGKDSLGECAVAAFFIMSGFLIAASWHSKLRLKPFFAARAARIFPGLIVMLLAVYLAGAFFSDKPSIDYLIATPRDVFAGLFLHGRFELTAAVFAHNPYPLALNGSLWTLRYEVLCYLMLGFLGWARVLRRAWVWLLWLAMLLLCVSAGEFDLVIGARPLFSLTVWFVSGMLVYLHAAQTPSARALAVGTVAVLALLFAGASPLLMSPLVAWVLLGWANRGGPLAGFGKFGDFSYGIYIYAFPIEQLVVYLLKSASLPCTWWMCCLLSFPLTLLCAVLSWHGVEKRALAYVHKVPGKVAKAAELPNAIEELVK